MPIRERRSGLKCVMSSPRYRIVPADAESSPESRLINVVLPAPFGPSNACRHPRWSSIVTLPAAVSPPKRRDSPCVARIASLIAGFSDERALEPAHHARKPAGQENHQQDDRPAEQQLPVRGDRREKLLQRHECERAYDRTVQAAEPAQDQHQEHVAGLMPRQELRIDEAE